MSSGETESDTELPEPNSIKKTGSGSDRPEVDDSGWIITVNTQLQKRVCHLSIQENNIFLLMCLQFITYGLSYSFG